MEDNSIAQNRARRAAFIIAIANFIGFSAILFIPDTYQLGIFLAAILFAQIVFFTPVGLLESVIIGFIIYFIFKHIKNLTAYMILLIILTTAALPFGFFSNVYFFRFVTGGIKEEGSTLISVDVNSDGKVDKWVRDSKDYRIVEIDTNFDGKPNIRETYKNKTLIKKELIPELDTK